MRGKDGLPVDLSVIPRRELRVTEFGYLCDVEEGWFELVNPVENFGFRLDWPRQLFRYVWLWQELRGSFGYPWYGRCYVMAVEPFTSIPGNGLARCVERDTAPLLAVGEEIEAELSASFFEVKRKRTDVSEAK
jgi:hypothetical protein